MTTYKRRLADLEEQLKGMPPENKNRVQHFFREMYRELLTDSLTRLPLRMYFKEEAGRLIEQAERHNLPLSMMMLDIDNFKKEVNDNPKGYVSDGILYRWHDAGDKLLKDVGSIINASMRAGDEFCRYGGEEIVGCLPMTNVDQAYGAAERLRRKIERNTGHTVSIGLTAYPIVTKQPDLDMLISHADHALKLAKDAGKNQVVMYPNGMASYAKIK